MTLQQTAPVQAKLNYVSPSSRINRRYFGPGFEINTAVSEWHEMPIFDGHDAQLTLDRNGFQLLSVPSQVRDMRAFLERVDVSNLENGPDIAEEPYAREVCDTIARVTGAQLVLPLNCIARTTNSNLGRSQPPAGDVHVDMNGTDALRNALRMLDLHGQHGHRFSRFLVTSFWRPLTMPPQDLPLALCDWQSVDDAEGVNNQFVLADQAPDLDNLPENIECGDDIPTGNLFEYRAGHRWYYFPKITPDQAIVLKLHDSDHSRAWRAPHTAFVDPGVTVAHHRESVEFRSVAYFD